MGELRAHLLQPRKGKARSWPAKAASTWGTPTLVFAGLTKIARQPVASGIVPIFLPHRSHARRCAVWKRCVCGGLPHDDAMKMTHGGRHLFVEHHR
jgi:hypothetical protein